jgi:hypothetical protein
MNKMLKDTVATVLVVGSFLVGAVTLVQEVSRPWPIPEVVQQLNTEDAPVNYNITADAPSDHAVTAMR